MCEALVATLSKEATLTSGRSNGGRREDSTKTAATNHLGRQPLAGDDIL